MRGLAYLSPKRIWWLRRWCRKRIGEMPVISFEAREFGGEPGALKSGNGNERGTL